MIPISDEMRTRRVPVVTWGLIAANALVFLFVFVFDMAMGAEAVDQLYMDWGAVPAFVVDPLNYPLAPLTLITSMFLHGGLSHFLGNMLYLWIFGDNVEDVLGHVWYLVFYVAAGLAAGLAQVVAQVLANLVYGDIRGLYIPGIGASGAIAGVLAAYMVLFPSARVRVLVLGYYLMRATRMPAVIVLGFWFILQLFNGALSLGTMSVAAGGVAWFAHIGGFVAGLAVGFVVRALVPQQPRQW